MRTPTQKHTPRHACKNIHTCMVCIHTVYTQSNKITFAHTPQHTYTHKRTHAPAKHTILHLSTLPATVWSIQIEYPSEVSTFTNIILKEPLDRDFLRRMCVRWCFLYIPITKLKYINICFIRFVYCNFYKQALEIPFYINANFADRRQNKWENINLGA